MNVLAKKESLQYKNDKNVAINELKALAKNFVEERDWSQFHTAKNLSMNITREASELMEYFIWASSEEIVEIMEQNRQGIEDELADILLSILTFANHYNVDITKAFLKKMKKTELKYPKELAYGKNKKYKALKCS